MNKIILAGKVYTEPEFSHGTHGKEFYKFYLQSIRTSGTPDILPAIAEKSLLGEIKKDDYVKIIGDIRTRNVKTDENMKLEIRVFVKEFAPYEDMDENEATLEGYICKNSYVRKTPRGRKISDAIVASHRNPNNKFTVTDYIPCIFWSYAAVEVEVLPLGTFVSVSGRLQSRDYKKKLPDGTVEYRTAYEFSVSEMED